MEALKDITGRRDSRQRGIESAGVWQTQSDYRSTSELVILEHRLGIKKDLLGEVGSMEK